MSDSLEEEFDEFRPRRSRRARILLFSVLGVIVAFFLVTLFASIYTDRLWYGSVGYSGVYDKMLWTRVGLFFGFGLFMALSVAANMVIAYRARPFSRPDSPEQTGLDRYRDAVAPIRTLLLVSVASVIGLFGGVAANGKWRTFLLWTNRESFNTPDPYFHKDVGFYVFTLPWLHFVVGYLIAVLVLSAVTAVVVHYLYGGIRLQSAGDRLSPTATIQLSVLGGLALLVKAVGYYLDRFDLVTGSSPVVTGMSYTDQHSVLPARNILIGVALVCALLFFITAWRRIWLLPGVGISLLVVTSILLGLIWPAFVQNFQVNPNKPDKEAPYIAANIEATRTAYDLNSIKLKQTAAPATPESVQSLIDQTNSVPVLDPSQLYGAFAQTQAVYGYYTVPTVLDVDHYVIDGTDRAVVIGARELDQTGINASDQNWNNLHTKYTHGSGVIAAFANQRPPDDSAESPQIQWAQGQDPGQDSLERSTGPFQDQIYFGEAGQGSPSYSIVGKAADAPDNEIDLTPNGAQSYTTYAGGGGVGVGGLFHKLMYAIKFGDANFLLSSLVGPDSKVLYYRDPAERVEKVAPWLTLDRDVYPVVENGHLLWVVDGYTTSDQYPQSERDSFSTMTSDVIGPRPGVRTLPTDDINYMRNAVKATVDAYTGEVKLYAWDESDPILRAWESAFPGTVLDRQQIPSALLPHLRYPEDMFKVQRYQYARYHVTDANTFFTANNQWQVSPDAGSKDENQAPIRMFTPDPNNQGKETWSLTSSYVPNNRTTLAGFVSANSDPTSPDYGTITVEQPHGESPPGPAQAYGQLSNDPRISSKTQSFRLGGSTPTYGNVVSVPLPGGPMYVVPVYATREGASTSSYLTLRYVMVSFGSKSGIGDTLVDAIEDMTGSSTTPPPNNGGDHTGNGHPGNGKPDKQTKGAMAKAHALLERAQRDFAAADQALNEGRAAEWVRLNHKARAEVAKALNLLQ